MTSTMNKKRILIVDDDIPLTQMVKFNLEATGEYEVRIENISTHAIQTAHQFRPDLILLDYIMPGMDGGDVSIRINEDPALRHVPVIMVTALVSNKEMSEDGTVQRGGHLMVAKPIKFEKLKRCIDSKLAEAA